MKNKPDFCNICGKKIKSNESFHHNITTNRSTCDECYSSLKLEKTVKIPEKIFVISQICPRDFKTYYIEMEPLQENLGWPDTRKREVIFTNTPYRATSFKSKEIAERNIPLIQQNGYYFIQDFYVIN